MLPQVSERASVVLTYHMFCFSSLDVGGVGHVRPAREQFVPGGDVTAVFIRATLLLANLCLLQPRDPQVRCTVLSVVVNVFLSCFLGGVVFNVYVHSLLSCIMCFSEAFYFCIYPVPVVHSRQSCPRCFFR